MIDAQRVMNLGDRDQILCTEGFDRDIIAQHKEKNLIEFGAYSLGEASINIYNYCNDKEFGNPNKPNSQGAGNAE
jgi:hypothetical protein